MIEKPFIENDIIIDENEIVNTYIVPIVYYKRIKARDIDDAVDEAWYIASRTLKSTEFKIDENDVKLE